MKQPKVSISDEEIYELREQGMTYQEIASYFDKKGIKISSSTIRERCKSIYEQKGKEEPKVKSKGPKRRKDITDKEIYELRERGLSYEAIASYFDKKGIKTTWETIRQRCKRIYMEKGKEEPKVKRKGTKIRKDITDKEIYELREQGMTYQEIASYFGKEGKKIALGTIRYRCKRIYEQKGEEEPNAKKKKNNIIKEITDEEIYELREQGMSYREIERHFKYRGKDISFENIRKRCKKIYGKKGKEEPKVKRKKEKKDITDEEIDITDEEIYELREQGMTYGAIVQFYEEKGIKIHWNTIRQRCKRIYKQKGKEESKIKRKGVTDEEIYELREQGMTYEAIVKFYEEKGIKIHWNTIRQRCKRIYRQNGKENPKVKRKKDKKGIIDEEIYELREQGMTYEAIAKFYEEKGINISSATIRERCKDIYEQKGKEIPKRKIDILDEEIYELRQQGISYNEIANFFKKKGKKISAKTIDRHVKRIYKQKEQEEPKTKHRKRKQDVTDEEIYKLREQGMSYREIEIFFKSQDIKISRSSINIRCMRIYEQKGKEEPKIKRKKYKKGIIDEEIYELREQGMSYEEISSYFGKKGIKISGVTIRERCKKIYEKKGKEEPKLKRGRKKQHKIDSESLEVLNEELNEKIKKKLEMEKILNTLRDYIERNTEGVEK